MIEHTSVEDYRTQISTSVSCYFATTCMCKIVVATSSTNEIKCVKPHSVHNYIVNSVQQIMDK